MSAKSIVGIVLAVCVIGLKLAKIAHRGSSHRPSSWQGAAYDDPTLGRSAAGLVDPNEALRDAARAYRHPVDRNCALSSYAYLEPQGDLEGVTAAFRRALLPEGTALPPSVEVMGLQVQTLRWDRDDDHALCVDLTAAEVRALAERSRGPSILALSEVGPGAWLVNTKPNAQAPATTALVSKVFLEQLKTKGLLVAFAPTDHQVAFADSASPAAVSAAVEALLANIDLVDGGAMHRQPLLLKNGTWRPWVPPAKSAALTRLAEASQHAMTRVELDFCQTLLELSPYRTLPVAPPPVQAVVNAIWSHEAGSTLRLTTEESSTLLIPRAKHVAVDGLRLSWPRFASAVTTSLRPATLDGKVIADLFVLEAGFRLNETVALTR